MDIATYYPNILFKHGMNESSLTTVKYPVVDGHGTYDGLVDMEASNISQNVEFQEFCEILVFPNILEKYARFRHRAGNHAISYGLTGIFGVQDW